MERLSIYNVSYHDQTTIKRRQAQSIHKNKAKRSPFFLPKIHLYEGTDEKGKCQRAKIELDVRGIGKNTSKDDSETTKIRKPKGRKLFEATSLSSPGNNTEYKSSGVHSLPPIVSKGLISHAMDNISTILDKQEIQHCPFDFAYDALVNVIERSKQQQKLYRERFHENIVRGKQKPVNEKFYSQEQDNTSCSLESWT